MHDHKPSPIMKCSVVTKQTFGPFGRPTEFHYIRVQRTGLADVWLYGIHIGGGDMLPILNDVAAIVNGAIPRRQTFAGWVRALFGRPVPLEFYKPPQETEREWEMARDPEGEPAPA